MDMFRDLVRVRLPHYNKLVSQSEARASEHHSIISRDGVHNFCETRRLHRMRTKAIVVIERSVDYGLPPTPKTWNASRVGTTISEVSGGPVFPIWSSTDRMRTCFDPCQHQPSCQTTFSALDADILELEMKLTVQLSRH
jgi:hypothetical protein